MASLMEALLFLFLGKWVLIFAFKCQVDVGILCLRPQVARAGKVILARLRLLAPALWALVGGKGSASPIIDTLATLKCQQLSQPEVGGGQLLFRHTVRISSAFLGGHVPRIL